VNQELHKLAADTSIDGTSAPGSEESLGLSASLNGHRAETKDRRVQVVLMLLEKRSERQWELDEIAKLVNLSPGRLAHLFKNETGVSIQQYLTQIRLTKARHHLESGFLSIKEIAASVGFRNVTRFCASFKTAVGSTPAEYRRRPASAPARRKDLSIARSANK